MQDTFLRAYEHLRRGTDVNVRWLYTVARNRAMDEFRQRQRLHSGGEEAAEAIVTSDVASERVQAVRQALARLSPSDREVLYLFIVDKFSTAEIASMLGIRHGALRVRLSRARERFRAVYGDQE